MHLDKINGRKMIEREDIRSKKGQGAETLTWVVATIIIVLLTFVFIYVSGEFVRLKFNFQSIEEKDSGKQSQEMLFAILQKKISDNGKEISVLDLIINNKYDIVSREVGSILDKFAAKDVKCSFYAYEMAGESRAQKVIIEKGGEGKSVSLEFFYDDTETIRSKWITHWGYSAFE